MTSGVTRFTLHIFATLNKYIFKFTIIQTWTVYVQSQKRPRLKHISFWAIEKQIIGKGGGSTWWAGHYEYGIPNISSQDTSTVRSISHKDHSWLFLHIKVLPESDHMRCCFPFLETYSFFYMKYQLKFSFPSKYLILRSSYRYEWKDMRMSTLGLFKVRTGLILSFQCHIYTQSSNTTQNV